MKKEGTDEYYDDVNSNFYQARGSPTEEMAKENLLCIKDHTDPLFYRFWWFYSILVAVK